MTTKRKEGDGMRRWVAVYLVFLRVLEVGFCSSGVMVKSKTKYP